MSAKKNIEKHTFQAEVSKVMDIVVNSLYTDREIFVRELISNAVDALEKIRHLNLVNEAVSIDPENLKINIELDKDKKTFTITDNGVGMTRDELVDNLGNIAHSGAREFLEKLAESGSRDVSLIGQFGVGFYSVFMAADRVTVRTKSWQPDADGYEWISDGREGYTLSPKSGLDTGTTIILELKENAGEFSEKYRIQAIVEKYSNYVPFPIVLDSDRINTVEAIWTRNKSDIEDTEYTEFYKYMSGAMDEPLDRLHFTTDAPLSLNALLFIPKENMERLGMVNPDLNVDLHCRKVLIQKHAKDLLPPWLRFVYGVVDSEDIPLNISRETMQDSALIRQINKAVTGRFIKFLGEMAKNEPDKYAAFWKEFGSFVKEGIVTDLMHRDKLADLLRFETSRTPAGESISLKEYTDRMPEGQKDLFFINGANRDVIEAGPYVEMFNRRNIEVIYTFEAVDDFVMSHLGEYDGKKLVSADSEGIELPGADDAKDAPDETPAEELPPDTVKGLADWIRKVLQDKVTEVRESRRLVDSPFILVNPQGGMTGAMQRVMQAMNKEMGGLLKRALEFNPSHPQIRALGRLREADESFAETLVLQLYDHAALAAGMPVDTRTLLERMNKIIDQSIKE